MTSLPLDSECLVGGGPTAEPALVCRVADAASDEERREALVRLRDRYVEAREHLSSVEEYENLEWILGVRGSATLDPPGFQTRTMELVSLWLQDLSVELDRRLEEHDHERDVSPTFAARHTNVQKFREATKRFLAAFLAPTPG